MRTKAKYLILFPAFTFATVSFNGGNQNRMVVDHHFLSTIALDDIAPKKYAYCNQGSTFVFMAKPLMINESDIRKEIVYKEKLNVLSQTVQNFLKIKLKKRKHR